jgi:hypothetical protein
MTLREDYAAIIEGAYPKISWYQIDQRHALWETANRLIKEASPVPDMARRRGRPQGSKLPYQEVLADTLSRSHFPDNDEAGYALVVACADRETTLREVTENAWLMTAWTKAHPSVLAEEKRGDYNPEDAEVYVELDRGVIFDLEDGVITAADLLADLRVAVLRIDDDGDVILHVTTVDRLDA